PDGPATARCPARSPSSVARAPPREPPSPSRHEKWSRTSCSAAERTTKTSDSQREVEEHMALTKCPECSGDVSDKASACPHCGYPMRWPGRVQIIEKTGRGWKAIRVLGWLLVIGGVLVLRASPTTHAAGG